MLIFSSLGTFQRLLGRLQEVLEGFWAENIDFSLVFEGHGQKILIFSGPRVPAGGRSYFRGFQPGVKVISRSTFFFDPWVPARRQGYFGSSSSRGFQPGRGVIFGVPAREEGYSRVPAGESRVPAGEI